MPRRALQIGLAAATVVAILGGLVILLKPPPTLFVGVDLPSQGPSKAKSDETLSAMQLYLDQVNGMAGSYHVKLRLYDNATAVRGGWDPIKCTNNAYAHRDNVDEVAVMGTLDSACTALEVPVLNGDPMGPMLMVSHNSGNPGLTKTWNPGPAAQCTIHREAQLRAGRGQ